MFCFRVQSDFCPLLKRFIDCPVYTVRELAASSLVQFLPTAEHFGFIDMLIKDTTSLNENLKHGIILMIKHLIEVQDDDKRISDGVTAKMLLAVSGSLLGNGIRASLATCTLLEIFKIILPKLCESTNNDDILLRGKFNVHASASFLPSLLLTKCQMTKHLVLILISSSVSMIFANFKENFLYLSLGRQVFLC